MKSNKIFIPMLIVFFAIAGYYYLSSSSSTIKKELRDFAVEDTSLITKIFLVDKQSTQILLERKGDFWTVNENSKVRKDAINLLLKTINRISVKSPVPKAAKENIIKRLSSKSTKIEIYVGDKIIKTYYVGDATQTHTGTYMLLENSASPFIMHIDGFNGYLSTRYFVEEALWKTSSIFSYGSGEIKSVSIKYPRNDSYSFKAISLGNNKFSLENIKGNKVENFDSIRVKQFIAMYKNVNYESPITNIRDTKVDSIKQSEVIYTFTVENQKGEINSINTYYVPTIDTTFYKDGTFRAFDMDRMYAFLNDGEDLVTIQYFAFDPIIKTLDDFIIKK